MRTICRKAAFSVTTQHSLRQLDENSLLHTLDLHKLEEVMGGCPYCARCLFDIVGASVGAQQKRDDTHFWQGPRSGGRLPWRRYFSAQKIRIRRATRDMKEKSKHVSIPRYSGTVLKSPSRKNADGRIEASQSSQQSANDPKMILAIDQLLRLARTVFAAMAPAATEPLAFSLTKISLHSSKT